MQVTSTDPLDHIWQHARELFARAQRAIGDTAALAARLWLYRDEAQDIRNWIAPVETLLRHLFLIEALKLAPPQPGPKAKRVGSTAWAPREPSHSFRFLTKPKPHPARVRQLGPPVLVRDIWCENARLALVHRLRTAQRRPMQQRLARRIDAIARVLAAPEQAIARLARKLHAAPKLAQRIVICRWPRSPYLDAAISGDASRYAWHAVVNSQKRDSS